MALDLFGDFGFVGAEDTTANPYQDRQSCINWFPEISPSQKAKEIVALLGTPGLVQVAAAPGGGSPGNGTTWPAPSSITSLPVRACWVLPGHVQAIVVIGFNCYIATIQTYGNLSQPGTLILAKIGTLNTSSGPVAIRDNGIGGFAVIVDGTYGYLYSLNGQAVTTTFQGELQTVFNGALASNQIQLNAQVPIDIVIGGVITDANGYFPGGTTLTGIDYSSGLLTISNYSFGPDTTQNFTLTIPAFSQISDPGFLGANSVAFIDGWWIFNQPYTSLFYTNAQPYALNFNPTYFSYKDAASDHLVSVKENKEELWLIGERTTEIWYDAGGQFFPFQRLVGTMLQAGCSAPFSVSRIVTNQEGLIWLGRSERGENVVVRTGGFTYETVSTPAVSNAIAQYTTTSDAIGYTYQEGDHEFYVLIFPTADATWVYDASMPPELAWHEWLSYDPYADQYHRHRSNCFMNFGGMRVVGDYQNGSLYQLTRNAYTDAGWPILAKRRSPYIWNKENRERVFMASLQVEFSPGQGSQTGLGQNPTANLRISRDYGSTFGPPSSRPMGNIGQFTNRCMWRKLGFSRGAVAQIEVIAPVNRDIVGATLEATGT